MKKIIIAAAILAASTGAFAKRLPGGATWPDCTSLGAQGAVISQAIHQGIPFEEMEAQILENTNLRRTEKAALLGLLMVLEEPQYQMLSPLQFGEFTKRWCNSK
ncbi:spanin [Burkholderia phage BcepF1]|uniref:Spanin n=1 Tax=Burkholderia phage BcepF1 TaxID=2886897 RepID=A1YZZ5_9CAUD|nr:spanin [Burkholderia phage BcepF1]ABL96822.1 spanin [Burkholderia phage BcepF1]